MHDQGPIEPRRPAERTYSRANVYSAVAAWLFNNDRYLSLATEHEAAVALGSRDIRAAFERGEYPGPRWEQESRERAEGHAILLRRS